MTMDTAPVPLEDVKLQLLQLRCIIDAKDREIHLLRKQLTSQEDADSMVILHSEIAHLRGEVQKLTLERNALRAGAGGAASLHGGTLAVASPASAGYGTTSGTQQQQPTATCPGPGPSTDGAAQLSPAGGGGGGGGGAARPAAGTQDGSLARMPQPQPVSPHSAAAAASLDPGALVEKLRGLVTGLVTEALAAQHQQQHQSRHQKQQSPQGPADLSLTSTPPSAHRAQPSAGPAFGNGDATLNLNAQTAGGPAWPSAPSARPPWGDSMQHHPQPPAPAAAPMTAAAVGYPAAPADGPSAPWPLAIQIIVQPAQLLPSGAYTGLTIDPGPVNSWAAPAAASHHDLTADRSDAVAPDAVNREGTATAGLSTCSTGGVGVGGGIATVPLRPPPPRSAPAVLELSVDGTTMYVERAVLDSQAAGSRLHRVLVQEYDKLPRDSRGMPYLSYDPQVFRVLMSHLKERHLFGSSADAAVASRNWSRNTAESLDVSPHYLAQAALHFGLSGLFDPVPHPHRDRGVVGAADAIAASALAPAAPAPPVSAAADPPAAPQPPSQPPPQPRTSAAVVQTSSERSSPGPSFELSSSQASLVENVPRPGPALSTHPQPHPDQNPQPHQQGAPVDPLIPPWAAPEASHTQSAAGAAATGVTPCGREAPDAFPAAASGWASRPPAANPPENPPWSTLPVLRVPVQPHGGNGFETRGGGEGTSESLTESATSAPAPPSLSPLSSSSPSAHPQLQRQAAVGRQVPVFSPSRIPPPPPLMANRPAAAAGSIAVAAGPEADVAPGRASPATARPAVLTSAAPPVTGAPPSAASSAADSSGSGSAVPGGWWQPFPDAPPGLAAPSTASNLQVSPAPKVKFSLDCAPPDSLVHVPSRNAGHDTDLPRYRRCAAPAWPSGSVGICGRLACPRGRRCTAFAAVRFRRRSKLGPRFPALLGFGQLWSPATLARYLERHRHQRNVRPR